MVKDMTVGKPLKLILAFCIPLVIGNIFQQVYNMADAIIVGHYLGNDAFGGVTSTGPLFFLAVGFSIGMTSGFGVKIAQAFGAGDHSKVRRYIANAVYISIAITIILTTVLFTCCDLLLKLTLTPEENYEYAKSYIIWIFGGFATIVLYNLCSAVCRALGDSRTPLTFLLIACVINIILDFFFIAILGFGTNGAGLATIIAQLLSGLGCLGYMRKKFAILKFQKEELTYNSELTSQMLKLSIPMALQSSITAAGMVILQTAVNSFGNVVVNSMGASTKIMSIATAPMETIGVTLATYAGQNLGAGKYSRIVTGIKQGTMVSMGYCVTMAVVMGFFGANLSGIFLPKVTPEIYGYVDNFMKLTVPFYVTLGLLFIFRNVLQSLGYGFIPMVGGIVELVVRSAVAFGLVNRFGYDIICLSGPLAWTAAMFVVLITFIVKIKQLRAICGVKKRELYDLSAKKNKFKCKNPEIMECPVC